MLKGEIKFKDGLIVHFEGYRGQMIDTIKYFDVNNVEVPSSKMIGKQREYVKITDLDNNVTRIFKDIF
ncbi:hypothetical protein [Ligilactobacillus salivarius]|uniref:hypothetical protein n=1 Tax=Ligilactobacillus salivarius TaxID=1624 RepID=UPI001786E1AB|nr:hypothetical protein [Ligilactobacillus salivarius]QXL48871.1 hypothetical protein IGB11_06695 [Ligilactobacillus salivarius]UHL93196.1 hypothetical protein LVD18_02410 [Ligilactobacillus salivarius]